VVVDPSHEGSCPLQEPFRIQAHGPLVLFPQAPEGEEVPEDLLG